MNSKDFGPCPDIVNVSSRAMDNQYFREAVWTGNYLQMTLMSIPACGEIGVEIHEDTDQMIRIENGHAIVRIGYDRNNLLYEQHLYTGDAVFVPARTWHNVVNMGKCPLKISSIYAPPHHKKGTIHVTKEAADASNY